MNPAEASIKNRVSTLVIIGVILYGGVSAFNNLGRLEDPEFTIKEAQVITSYPGATAREVEEEVTDRIETAVQQLGQLKKVTSISMPGLSIVRPEMKDKYDNSTLPQVWDELRRKVGDVQDQLPPGTSTSVVNDDFGDVYGVFLCLYGDGYTYAELLEYAKLMRRELLLVQDVAKVNLYGEQQEALFLEISRARLAQLGLSPDTIAATLANQNQITPSGRVEVDSKFVRIRPTGEFDSVENLGNLLILQDDRTQTKLYLKDIAEIHRDYVTPPKNLIRYDGHRGIGLGVSTSQGGNVVVMGEALKKRMKELIPQIPVGIEVGVISIQADSVSESISAFLVNLMEAIGIVFVVLLLTMGLRSGVIIGVILLLTILSTFMVMQFKGVNLERISLGALIIALGMLVDNAIVVVEGIIMGMQRGKKPFEAAIAIVKQTMWPLLAATVVAILTFAAIGTSPDKTGEYCRSLFQVILYSLMLSWLLAITVTPLLGVMFLKGPKVADGPAPDPYQTRFFRGYRGLLEATMRWRWLTLGFLLATLMASVYGFGFISKSFFPPSTRPQFLVHCWLPQGTHILKTEEEMAKLEKFVQEQESVSGVTTFVGQGAMRFLLTYQPEEPNTAYGLLLVSVDDYTSIPEVTENLQAFALENLPNSNVYARKFVLGPGDPQKIQVRFRGPDHQVLRRLAEETKSLLRAAPEIMDVSDDWRQRVSVVRPIIAETKARNAGLTRTQVAGAIQGAFEGQAVGLYRERDLSLPIIVRSPQSERQDVSNLDAVQVWSPTARSNIPLAQLVVAYESDTQNDIIRRRNRLPTITVKCDPAIGEAVPAFAAVRPKIVALYEELGQELDLSAYSLEWGGEYENSNDAKAGLSKMLPPIAAAMILIVIILFNSVRQPLVIFLTVPLGLIGVTTGLLVFDKPFGFMALLGFLSLTGMIIKNAIVLIDEINLNLSQDRPPYLAVIEAGVSRVRPVSNAALTTVLGMTPLVFDPFYSAMAVTIMAGLTFATVLTLVVIPILYVVIFRIPSPSSKVSLAG